MVQVVSRENDFMMHGARVAIDGGMIHISEQVKALESAIHENTGLAFDLAKTIIESVCKTILSERSYTFDKSDDLPKLFKTVTSMVPFLPAELSAEAGARKSLQQTINGLSTALQGICELRNACGFASHGSDNPRPALEGAQALLAVQAADAIIGFLYRVHRQGVTQSKTAPIVYSNYHDFNEWIDEQSDPVEILSLPPYRASEVLFNVDIQSYRALFLDYLSEKEADNVAEQAVEKAG